MSENCRCNFLSFQTHHRAQVTHVRTAESAQRLRRSHRARTMRADLRAGSIILVPNHFITHPLFVELNKTKQNTKIEMQH